MVLKRVVSGQDQIAPSSPVKHLLNISLGMSFCIASIITGIPSFDHLARLAVLEVWRQNF